MFLQVGIQIKIGVVGEGRFLRLGDEGHPGAENFVCKEEVELPFVQVGSPLVSSVKAVEKSLSISP